MRGCVESMMRRDGDRCRDGRGRGWLLWCRGRRDGRDDGGVEGSECRLRSECICDIKRGVLDCVSIALFIHSLGNLNRAHVKK